MSRVRRIGIIAGTGSFGKGLAARLSYNYEVLIGSRERSRAQSAAEAVRRITGVKVTGVTNTEAAGSSDAAILALPNQVALKHIQDLKGALANKLVISPIVPMKVREGQFVYSLGAGSAAERVASVLKESRVAAAFHTLPAEMLLAVGKQLEYSVLVAAESKDVFSEVAPVVSSIKRLEPLYVGPLSTARSIESLTPLLLNLARLNGMKNPSIRIMV